MVRFLSQIYLLLLVCFLSGCATVQNQGKYARLVIKAELNIVAGQKERALQDYSKSFGFASNISYSDYYNMLLLADELKDSSFFLKAALRLREEGMCNDFFEQFNLYALPDISSNIQRSHPTSAKMSACNETLQQFYGLQDKDQENRYDKSYTHIVDSLNYVAFQGLLNNHGFPSNRTLGCQCADKGIPIQPWDILLIHFAQRDYGVVASLDKALNEEAITPAYYLMLWDYLSNKSRYASQFNTSVSSHFELIYLINGKTYMIKMSRKEKRAVNKLRRKVAFHSINDHIAIYSYCKQNTDVRRFILPCNIVIIDLDDETGVTEKFQPVGF